MAERHPCGVALVERKRGPVPEHRADGAAELLLADSSAAPAWKLQVEAWLREVDAGFSPAKQPAALAEKWQKLRERVQAP